MTVAAPDHNASGTSTSVTWRNVRVTSDEGDPRSFAIGGTPATAVVLAATALYPAGTRPDLVISGINDGDNAGPLRAVSGTVGGARVVLRDGEVVRARTALNVNYPALPVERVRGAVVTRQSRLGDLHVQYVDSGNGEYSARLTPMSVASDDVDSDRSRLDAGYVTVTPVSAALDDDEAPRRALARRLRKLDP